MQLWLVRRIDDENNYAGCDEVFGFVIRATDEIRALQIAAENCGEEGEGYWLESPWVEWILLARVTECDEEGIVLCDYKEG